MTDSDSSSNNVLLVEHPVVADRLTRLRDRKTPADSFRQTVSELSALIAYEALRGLGVGTTRIDTPIASDIEATRVTETVLLVPVLKTRPNQTPKSAPPQSAVAAGCSHRPSIRRTEDAERRPDEVLHLG